MKKLLATVLALCTLSAAVGMAACDGASAANSTGSSTSSVTDSNTSGTDSTGTGTDTASTGGEEANKNDEEQTDYTVTEEKWNAAFSYEKFLNCTVKYEYSGGTVYAYYDFAVENGVTTGKEYIAELNTTTNELEDYAYASKTADYYATALASTSGWVCNYEGVDLEPDDKFGGDNINVLMLETYKTLFFAYGDYTYDSQSETYVSSGKKVGDYTYAMKLKFENGYIVYANVTETDEDGKAYSNVLTYSDYGKTSVTIPAEVSSVIAAAVEQAESAQTQIGGSYRLDSSNMTYYLNNEVIENSPVSEALDSYLYTFTFNEDGTGMCSVYADLSSKEGSVIDIAISFTYEVSSCNALTLNFGDYSGSKDFDGFAINFTTCKLERYLIDNVDKSEMLSDEDVVQMMSMYSIGYNEDGYCIHMFWGAYSEDGINYEYYTAFGLMSVVTD